MNRPDDEEVDERIAAAVRAALVAGAAWTAARYDKGSAALWTRIAERYDMQIEKRLAEFAAESRVRSTPSR